MNPSHPESRHRNRGESRHAAAVGAGRPSQPDRPALCSDPRPPEWAPGRAALALQLAFDSLCEPAPAAQRGSSTRQRHLVYLCRDYAVDVHLEGRKGDGPLVHGELLSRHCGPLSEVPAFLFEGDQIAGYDRTGRLGDFHLQAGAAPDLRICLLLDADHCIDLPIRLDGSSAAWSS